MVAGRTGLSSVGLGAPSALAPFARGTPEMAALALILAATGLVSLVDSAVTGSPVSLASSLLHFAASGLCALAWGIVP